MKAIAHQLRAGYSVSADWFQSSILFKGVFSSPNEPFNKEYHRQWPG
jgi:hypothetical protein